MGAGDLLQDFTGVVELGEGSLKRVQDLVTPSSCELCWQPFPQGSLLLAVLHGFSNRLWLGTLVSSARAVAWMADGSVHTALAPVGCLSQPRFCSPVLGDVGLWHPSGSAVAWGSAGIGQKSWPTMLPIEGRPPLASGLSRLESWWRVLLLF